MKTITKLITYILIVAIMLCGCSNITKTVETTAVTTEVADTVAIATEPIVETTVPETEPPTEPVKELDYFREDIYYDYEYVDSGDLIPHGLFTPSTASEYEKIPLILWLHGAGEKNSKPIEIQTSGMTKALTAWDFMHLEGINAYVVAPHLVMGDFWSPFWCTEESQKNVKDMLDYYIENYNVDPDKIVVTGHSLGAQGTLYMAQVLPEYFCAMAPLSSYNPCIPLTNTEIPTWCFVGESSCGEDRTSVSYTWSDFKHVYGEDCITSLPVGHCALPWAVFSMDEDGNSRTDVFEWFVEQMSA